jgi:pimeloyl-ACP methyl ester carboxylesterase
MRRTVSGRAIAALSIFSIIFSVGLRPSAGQTRRAAAGSAHKAVAAAQPKQAPLKCAGGWRGVVTFKKTLSDSLESDEPGIRKAIDRIKHKDSRNYEYIGKAIVDGKEPMNPIVNTNVSFSDIDLKWGEERVFDTCNSRENGHWFIIEGIDNSETSATATGSARSFHLNVDEGRGTYSFGLKFPEAAGRYKRVQDVKRSGHCQPRNNLPYNKVDDEPTKIAGESFSIDGQLTDPGNPDTISGTKVWGDDGTGSVRTFVYSVTWTFTRCPETILVTDIKFEDMRVPDWNAWKEVNEHQSTIDGNVVRITAKVLNLSSETKYVDVRLIETYKGDKWDGAKKDYPLKNPVSVRLEAGEGRDVEWTWNTQGYAWYDDGRPRPVQRVRAEAWESEKLKHSRTENLRIAPKPVVFVAGIWSSPQSFEVYQNYLTSAHSYDWKAAIFTRKARSNAPSVYDNADDLAEFVKATQKKLNAWHVDMVAHSTGGLVGRLFIHKQMERMPDEKAAVKHFLMLGTPNLGVPCADSMKYNEAFGPNMRTAQELMPEEMARFNQFVKERKGTHFSALVGNASQMLCASWEPSDGFASVESARHGVSEVAYTSDSHPDLVDPKHFGTFMKPRIVTGPMGSYPLYLQARERQQATK